MRGPVCRYSGANHAMRPVTIILTFTALLSVEVAADTLYRCQDAAGQTLFSDAPCGPTAEAVELNIHRPSASEQRDAQSRAAQTIAISDEIQRERLRQRELARAAEIQLQQERQRQAERERELAAREAEREREREQAALAACACEDRGTTTVRNGSRRWSAAPPHQRPQCRERTRRDFNPPDTQYQRQPLPPPPSGLRPYRPERDSAQRHPHRPAPQLQLRLPNLELIYRSRR